VPWLLCFLVACQGDGPDSADTADTGACPDGSLRTWENTGAPFLSTWCVPCHGVALPESERQGAPLGVDLDTHEDARTWADRVAARALDLGNMPPVGDPEAEDLEALAEWLACGLP